MADNRVLTDPNAPPVQSFFGNLPAKYAGWLRGLVVALAVVGLTALADYLKVNPIPGQDANLTGVLVALIMGVVGMLDQRRTTP